MLVTKITLDSPLKQRRIKPLGWVIIFAAIFFVLVYFFQLCLSISLFRYKISNNFNEIYVSRAAKQLPLETSIFAWIMTAPLHHKTRVPAINATWLHRLEHAEIFTSEPLQDERIPFRTVFKDFDDSYNSLFYKTRFGFYYAYKGISDKFDWYLKVDDDTYLVAENLVKFLSTLNPNEPIYAGFRLKPYLKNGYNSGSVYALSRAAVKIFVDSLYNDSQKCPFDQYEDLGMGRCLSNAGIYPIQTRDRDDKGRFHIFDAFNTYTANNTPDQYEFYYKDTHKPGFEEFSKDLISLHHMQPRDIITADLFLYRVNIN